MKPWEYGLDIPFEHIYPDTALPAVREGLRELFKRYPARLMAPMMLGGDRPATQADVVAWRQAALTTDTTHRALLLADNTGVPQEELIALGMLAGLPLRGTDE